MGVHGVDFAVPGKMPKSQVAIDENYFYRTFEIDGTEELQIVLYRRGSEDAAWEKRLRSTIFDMKETHFNNIEIVYHIDNGKPFLLEIKDNLTGDIFLEEDLLGVN